MSGHGIAEELRLVANGLDPLNNRHAGGVRLRVLPASRVEVERPTWLWEGRIPLENMTLLVGRQGLGKSTLVAELVAQASRGKLDGDLHGERVCTLLVTAEDSHSVTVVPRLQAAGADLER